MSNNIVPISGGSMPRKYLSNAAKRKANKDKAMQNAKLTKIPAFGFVSTNATKPETMITTTQLDSMDKSSDFVLFTRCVLSGFCWLFAKNRESSWVRDCRDWGHFSYIL